MPKNMFSTKFKYWADELIEQLDKSVHQRVDDMKTPSGHAHAGSLRAIATHGLVYEAMRDAGYDVEFCYVINDHDPMDGMPVYLDAAVYNQHMGKPLLTIPAPDGKSENFAMQYANEYIAAFNTLGFYPKIYKSSEMYKHGLFNEKIIQVLNHVETIREIYLEVAGQTKPEGWYPFQVNCPNCGKVGSSLVTDWDGTEVTYECKTDLVKWAVGCGHKGKISPLNGNGKLMWKVDWPAHWGVMNVTVEGAGKDHFSQGGSRNIATEITDKVFKTTPPFGFLHEFLQIGGAKMSSSKGNAMTAYEFSQSLPATVGRFLFVRTDYQRAINFDPSNEATIPNLFDEYDNCAEAWFESGNTGKFGRMYEAAQFSKPVSRERVYVPRFRYLVSLLIAKDSDIKATIEKQKGSTLNTQEIELLEERIKYAKIWLGKFAPAEKTNEISKELPSAASNLDEVQVKFLAMLADMLIENSYDNAEDLQTAIYNLAKANNIPGKKAFESIYLSLIGKSNGPIAGKLVLEALANNKEFIINRFKTLS